MNDKRYDDLITNQFRELAKVYESVNLSLNPDGAFVIRGLFSFETESTVGHKQHSFQLEIVVPANFPIGIPLVKETGGRIPGTFHTSASGYLCLDVPLELRLFLKKNGTLLAFINGPVVNFLWAFEYRDEFGEMPNGEWSHGGQGIVEYYLQKFQVKDETRVLGLLRLLADDDYRDYLPCPCGSLIKTKKCHGQDIQELRLIQTPGDFKYEYDLALSYLDEGKVDVPLEFICISMRHHRKHSKY